MKIYYVKLDNNEVEKLSRAELKKLQSLTGRKIVDYVGKNYYSVNDREIIVENNKPKFKNSEIQFSISHSDKIVAVAFDGYPVGLDIEFMKERNFKQLGEHYNINTSDKIEFYKKWTQLEAEIKLQTKPEQSFTDVFEEKYMLTVVSSQKEKLFVKPEELFI